jgi:hypothetical protein
MLSSVEAVIHLLKQNMGANETPGKIEVRELNWGQDISFLNPPFDFVIGNQS